MLLSLVIWFAFNPGAYDTVTRAMPIWAFLLAYCVIGLLCLAFAGAYHRHVMAEGYELYTKLINAAIFTIVLASCVAFMLNLQLPRTALIIATVGRAGVRTGRPLDDAVPATTTIVVAASANTRL